MDSFSILDDKSERQVRLLRTFQRKRREFILRKHLAEAAIQIADAIVPLLNDDDPAEVRIKGRLLRRSSSAFMRLANHPGAIRFSEFRIRKATEWLQNRGIL